MCAFLSRPTWHATTQGPDRSHILNVGAFSDAVFCVVGLTASARRGSAKE